MGQHSSFVLLFPTSDQQNAENELYANFVIQSVVYRTRTQHKPKKLGKFCQLQTKILKTHKNFIKTGTPHSYRKLIARNKNFVPQLKLGSEGASLD